MSVNIRRYLPSFLFKKDPVNTEIHKSVEEELEVFYKKLENYSMQYFIPRATWGLKMFEENYKLPVKQNFEYEVRRMQVVAKKKSSGTATVERIKHIVESFIEGTVSIEEYYEAYAFTVFIEGTIYSVKELRGQLEEVKPAHLGYAITQKVTGTIEDNTNNIETIIIHRATINFYNTIYLYLDATWELGDDYKINGIKSGTKKDDYSTVHIITGMPVQIECGGEVEIDAIWYIDGTYLLDGSKILNGTVWREEL